MRHLKKAVCILIAAALVVCFAFALVACNNAKPETMTDADFAALKAYAAAVGGEASSSFRGTITTENETKVVSIYSNSVTIDTTHTDADGKVTRTYYLWGVDGSDRTIEAQAVYEGDATLATSNDYKRNSDVKKSDVTANSGISNATDTISSLLGYISGTVTKHSDSKLDYEISYCTDDSGKANANIVAHVENGMLASVTVTKDGVSYTTTYEYEIGSMQVPTQAQWKEELHPIA